MQRTDPFALKDTVPTAVGGSPFSDRVACIFAVSVNAEDGIDWSLSIEIAKPVSVLTVSVTEFDEVEPV